MIPQKMPIDGRDCNRIFHGVLHALVFQAIDDPR